ncbi:hypothetical protein B7R22_08850 [Subtercola boreus]|uniref:DUF3071 domain-containing protein n=1 Tax=Subtercola boreus TaxID=120213 RepID=A0A3E0VZ90_9MICO|nr:septation protein SepH [Subtercola boreus]RFA14809.1 hypothetical protein B7R22_08850 [Subtercola boreus]
MQDLTVIGIENGALLVSSETGERYRVAIDEVLQSRLRQSTSAATTGVKVSPREIQSQIRAGMSAEDVARATGASLEYVERFEGPVVAERLHIVSSALKVAVKVASSNDPLRGDPLSDEQSSTFGEIIEERLAGLGATDLRWASWKEESGWIVKLTFTASEIDHDARWQYEPKRHSLTPLNSGAITLSQHGELSDGLIPRLRAVDLNGVETTPAGPGIQRTDGLGRSDALGRTDSPSRTAKAGLGLDELDAAFGVDQSDDDLGSQGRYADDASDSDDETARPDSRPAAPPAAERTESPAARSIWGSVARSASASPTDSAETTTREPGRGPTAPPVIVDPTPFARPASRTDQESSARAAAAAVNRATPPAAAHNETADLLEALRRRRGERESASFTDDGDDLDSYDDGRADHPSQHAHAGMFTRGSSGLGRDSRPVAHLTPAAESDATSTRDDGDTTEQAAQDSADTPLAGLEATEQSAVGRQRQTGSQPRRKARASMPSWDEIVFGARSDDDLS